METQSAYKRGPSQRLPAPQPPALRLSFILSSLWLSGGVQLIIEYANRLTLRGHRVHLIAPSDTLDAEIADQLHPDVHIHLSRAAREKGRQPVQMARLAWSLAAAIPPSDIVVSTHTPTTVSGWIASRLLRRGQPVWLFLDYREMFADRPMEQWLMRHALLWHKLAMVISDSSRRELLSYTKGQVEVIGVGLNHPELLQPLASVQRPSALGKRPILFVGDERPRKGLSDFLRAAEIVHQRHRDILLWIVCKYDCQIDSTVPHEVIHRPARAELAQLYASCDLFVSASWREGLGLPPLEAMACGAPVVLTDSGGAREYARHQHNCLLVPPRVPQALAAAMVQVLTDSALAERLRRQGPITAGRFTWDRAIDLLESALTKASPGADRAPVERVT